MACVIVIPKEGREGSPYPSFGTTPKMEKWKMEINPPPQNENKIKLKSKIERKNVKIRCPGMTTTQA